MNNLRIIKVKEDRYELQRLEEHLCEEDVYCWLTIAMGSYEFCKEELKRVTKNG